jgi:hypothetical protein
MKKNPLAIDLIVFLLGILSVLSSVIIKNSIIQNLLAALGTGLIAASVVSFLFRLLYTAKTDNDMVKIEDPKRIKIEKTYNRLREESTSHDVASIALSGALSDFIERESLLNQILSERKAIRLIFLSLNASYLKQRAKEDGVLVEELQGRLKASLEKSHKIYNNLKKLHEGLHHSHPKDRIGSFDIRVMDECPYFTVFRVDDIILWGIFLCFKPGTESPVLRVEKKNKELFDDLKQHFQTLWDNNRENWIVQYDRGASPKFNDRLYNDLMKTENRK